MLVTEPCMRQSYLEPSKARRHGVAGVPSAEQLNIINIR